MLRKVIRACTNNSSVVSVEIEQGDTDVADSELQLLKEDHFVLNSDDESSSQIFNYPSSPTYVVTNAEIETCYLYTLDISNDGKSYLMMEA